MLLKIYENNTNDKHIRQVTDLIRNGGVFIFPTDSVYGLGCSINHPKAIERVAKIKGVKLEKSDFSFIFPDLSSLSEYTKPIDNVIFKLIKKNSPGAFTFILHASNRIPKIFKNKKKTIGIRIPDNQIIIAIAQELGTPILTTSIHDDDEVIEYTTDPELIHEKYQNVVDLVIDGGYGKNEASTVVDCTALDIEIIRQGVGELI